MFDDFKARLSRDLNAISAKAKRNITVGLPTTDSLWLALAAEQAKVKHKHLTVIAENASEALRMLDEIRYFAPQLTIEYFPDWETLPYDLVSPHQDLVSERLEILYRLMGSNAPDVLLTTSTTASQTIAPTSYLEGRVFFFKKGEEINAAELKERLVSAGYSNVSQVVAPGEFSVRGSLIDIFPMGAQSPFRLDLFDTEIDSIRSFDPDTQRSIETVNEIRILPGREYPVDAQALVNFRAKWREAFAGDPTKYTLYKDLSHGVINAGIEYYLPLFFNEFATLFDYLKPERDIICLCGDNDAALKRFTEETQGRYRFLAADTERPVLPVDALYLNSEKFFVELKRFERLEIKVDRSTAFEPNAQIERKLDNPTDKLERFLQEEKVRHHRVLILAASTGRRETMGQLFSRQHLNLPYVETFEEFLNSDEPVL